MDGTSGADAPTLFLGTSESAERVRQLVRRAARVDSTVLVVGESGVGKELVAREIHLRSRRANGPFHPVNCSAIPEALVEAELFGHEAGAFTGARGRHIGAFELANGGTLFLDEVADMSEAAQPKLLRVLETGEIFPVGGERARPVDLRVIAATNRPLKQMARDGAFRADLYYRLCVFELRIPPLRHRREDIAILARHFVEAIGDKMGQRTTRITDDALELLSGRQWPGNVRELKNAVESAMAMHSGFVLHADCFDPDSESGPHSLTGLLKHDFKTARAEFEAAYVRRLLDEHEGNVTKAAQAAGVARRSLYKILQRLGLQPGRGSS